MSTVPEELRTEMDKLKGDIHTHREVARYLLLDLRARKFGYRIHYAVDFSEIFRYLCPYLDRLQYTHPDIFGLEQLAIHYIFYSASQDDPLVLLPPYYGEFRRHLSYVYRGVWNIAKTVSSFGEDIDHLSQLRGDVGIKRVLDALAAGVKADDEKVRQAMDEAARHFFDLLAAPLRQMYLGRGMDEFQSLVRTGRLVMPSQIVKADEALAVKKDDQVYKEISRRMQTLRPRAPVSNDTDAEAAWMVRELNLRNNRQRHLYYLASGTRAIWDAFLMAKFAFTLEGESPETPVLRSLYYFLMKFYYDGEPLDTAIKRLTDFLSLTERYYATAEKFEQYVVSGFAKDSAAAMLTEATSAIFSELKSNMVYIKGAFTKPVLAELDGRVKDIVARSQSTEARRDVLRIVLAVVNDREKLKHELEETLEVLRRAEARLDEAVSDLISQTRQPPNSSVEEQPG